MQVSHPAMPIDIREFKTADETDLKVEGRPPEELVTEFLAFDPSKAYTRREIRSNLDLSTIELANVLARLKRDGLVRNKGSYWAISEDATDDRV